MMIIPGLVFLFVFCYIPMFGVIIAFKNYNFRQGFFGSPWVGLQNFKFYFTSDKAWSTTFNTVYINSLFIFSGLIFQMGSAILLNEIRKKIFKRLIQSFIFFPYFISWVVVGEFAQSLLFNSKYGIMNKILLMFGADPVNWYTDPGPWIAILVAFSVWKWTGYGVILYLATIVGIDIELYEAAEIDGASKFQQIRYITMPFLIQTATILVLLAVGRIFFGDFQMLYSIIGDNGMLLDRTDVIDTYVFRALRQGGDFGMPSAIGLYQSTVGFVLVLLCNFIVRRYQKENALF